jgi:hypothetical protein
VQYELTVGLVIAAAATNLIAASPVTAAPIPSQGTWQATLQARDLNGDSVTDAFYDKTLNITWLRDANVNGTMNWSDANSWASAYSIGAYSGWRLPTMVDTGPVGCDPRSAVGGTDCEYNVDTSTSEMAHLYYVTLGNLAACKTASWCPQPDQPGWGLTNTGDFLNMGPEYVDSGYWLGRENTLDASRAWYFENHGGYQHDSPEKTHLFHAMLVRSGDVPEPNGLYLALTAIGALALARRRQGLWKNLGSK